MKTYTRTIVSIMWAMGMPTTDARFANIYRAAVKAGLTDGQAFAPTATDPALARSGSPRHSFERLDNPMSDVEAASKALSGEVARSYAEGDGCLVEADEGVNEASRAVIRAMHAEHGVAWLGKINLHGDERGKAEHAAWPWDGEAPLYNFGCAWVAPVRDEELVRLILERDAAPYTGTATDSIRIERIFARLEAIGGHYLLWT
jgi:hypothetical protein